MTPDHRKSFDRWRLDCHNALMDVAIQRKLSKAEFFAGRDLARYLRERIEAGQAA